MLDFRSFHPASATDPDLCSFRLRATRSCTVLQLPKVATSTSFRSSSAEKSTLSLHKHMYKRPYGVRALVSEVASLWPSGL